MTDGKDTAFEFRFLATSTMDSKRTIKWGGNALLAMIHLTVVGDKVVYASEELSKFAPSPLPVSPEWSPVKLYGGMRDRAVPDLNKAAPELRRHPRRLLITRCITTHATLGGSAAAVLPNGRMTQCRSSINGVTGGKRKRHEFACTD